MANITLIPKQNVILEKKSMYEETVQSLSCVRLFATPWTADTKSLNKQQNISEENQPAKQKQAKTRRKRKTQNIAHTQSTVTTTSNLFPGGQILFTI